MQRILEPELMEDPVQAAAYAAADFSDPHDMFIKKFREKFPGTGITGEVLDLGCGPADISIRFAQAYPACRIHGVEGSRAMLREGEAALARSGLRHRIGLIEGVIPAVELPRSTYHVILSNSLLHHLHEPAVLWECIKKFSGTGTLVFVMDLLRPETRQEAWNLVQTYSKNEPEILKRDFYNSLCAACRPEEVKEQIEKAGLVGLALEVISDRHWIVYGAMTAQ